MEQIDRQGTVSNNNKSATSLQTKMENLKLVDTYHFIHQNKPGYTWHAKNRQAFSRLDYILLSDYTVQFIDQIKVLPSFKSDHSILILKLTICTFNRGPGYWKLNTSLLHNRDYLEKINRYVGIELGTNTASTYSERWELFKLGLVNTSFQYSVNHKKSNKQKILLLEHKMTQLQEELYGTNPVHFKDTNEQLYKVKQELEILNSESTRGAILRSRARWATLGEAPTKYFLNLEKANYCGKTLYRLKTNDGSMVTEERQILKEIHKYYKKLYTSNTHITGDYLKDLNVLKIDNNMRDKLEKPISVEELSKALYDMPNNKCLGTDGIPPDLLKIIWGRIKYFLLEVYKEAIEGGELHLTARCSVISLLEKVGQDDLRLNSWRPLSLLNTDNKLYAKVLANHMQEAMDAVIHPSQTGFMKGYYLAENVMKINEIMNHCDRLNIPGVIISFDFYKAFDTVEFKSLFKALEIFGFGEQFLKMVKVLFTNQLATVSNNGFWSDWFTPTWGTRQGCCFSPKIFILLVELLGIGIRKNDQITGIIIGNSELKAGQFADDLWTALLATSENINAVLTEIDRFSMFSGLKINSDKCKVLKIGPFKDSEAKFYTMKRLFWSPKKASVHILGIHVTPDTNQLMSDNYLRTLKKAEDILESWSHRNLSLVGKITIVNTLVSSLFMHLFLA